MCCCASWCCDKLDAVRLMTPFLAADGTWLWIQGFRSFFGALWEGGWWNAFVAVVIVAACTPVFVMAVRARYFAEDARAKWFMIYAAKNLIMAFFALMWAFVAFGWRWPAAGLVWLFTVPFSLLGAYISYKASGASLTMETLSKVRRLGGGGSGGRLGTDDVLDAYRKATPTARTLDVTSMGAATLNRGGDQTIYSSRSLITPVNGRRVLPALEQSKYQVPQKARSSSKVSTKLGRRQQNMALGASSTLGYKKRSQSQSSTRRGTDDGLHYLETGLREPTNHYMNTARRRGSEAEVVDEESRESTMRPNSPSRERVERPRSAGAPRLSTNHKLAAFYANLPSNTLAYPALGAESATDLEAGMSAGESPPPTRPTTAGNMTPRVRESRRGSDGSHQSRRSRRSRKSTTNNTQESGGKSRRTSRRGLAQNDTSV